MAKPLSDWLKASEDRLKPTDLTFLDKQLTSLMEVDEEIEKRIFTHPLSVVLVKFANYRIEFVLVPTDDLDALVAIASRADDWYEAYGVRAYSIKQAYDHLSFFATPLESTSYAPTDLPIPEYVDSWSWDVPLSMNQLEVKKIKITT